MSPVHKLSQIGSLTGNKIDYPSMLAGYGDFGALQRIGYATGTGSSPIITFLNIPQTFQDLMLVMSGRATDNTNNLLITQVNALGLSVSSGTFLLGNGSSATSGRAADYYGVEIGLTPGTNTTSGIHASTVVHYLNYRSANFKTFLARNAMDLNGSGQTRLTAGLIRTTDAVNRIEIFSYAGGNLTTTTTAALYGVKASAA